MTTPPADRKYSDSHEWHKVDGDVVTIGITTFAVEQLTDLTYVEMKGPGTAVSAGEPIGEVESVKTTSEIYCHVGGEVSEVNGAVVENPGLVNDDPYGAGWLVKVKMSDGSGLEGLRDASGYASEHMG